MKDSYVVFIGATDIDEYYETDRPWPKNGSKCFFHFKSNELGGMISNAACVMAGYGQKTYLIDTMNESENSALALKLLKEYGLDTSYIFRDKTIPDAKCIIFQAEGERTIMVIDAKKPVMTIEGRHRDLLFGADYLYSIPDELVKIKDFKTVLTEARAAGVKLCMDIEAHKLTDDSRWLLAHADLLFINDDGVENLRGSDSEDVLFERLFANGTGMLVVTKGGKGCTIVTPKGQTDVPAFSVKPVDTTGAGDTFNSSFLYQLLRGAAPEKAARFACAAAGRAVTIYGPKAGVAKEQDVLDFIKTIEQE